jgi:hypothetical protein
MIIRDFARRPVPLSFRRLMTMSRSPVPARTRRALVITARNVTLPGR